MNLSAIEFQQAQACLPTSHWAVWGTQAGTSPPREDHIFKRCLFFHSKLLIPLYYIRRDPPKKSGQSEVVKGSTKHSKIS